MHSLETILQQYGKTVRQRFEHRLHAVGHTFPPEGLTFLAFKEEQRLQVYAMETGSQPVLLGEYPFTAMSGVRGPKRREGDRQIPEGMYDVEYLNPNSRYHLSFKISYPNLRDRARAQRAGITQPGSDIFIHGGAESVGCMAIGDEAIEEVFVLLALTGKERARIFIFPNDARRNGHFLPDETGADDVEELYRELHAELAAFA